MKFNSKKYNIIVCLTLVLIGLVYFVSACFFGQGFADGSDDPLNPNNPSIIVPDVPPTDEIDDGSQTEKAPVFSNGYEAIKYAIDILNSGTPFIYQFYNTTVSADAINVDVYEKLYRYKNHDLMMIWSKTDASIPVVGEIAEKKGTFFRFAYSNCEKKCDRYIYDANRFSKSNKTFQFTDSDTISGQENFKDYIITDKTKDWGNFYLTVNKTTSKVVYFDKTDENNYIIKVSMYPSKINMKDSYVTAQTSNGMVEKLTFDYLNLTFTISKKTGRLIRCVREDAYTLYSNVGGVSLSCKSSATQLYTYTETEQTIKDMIKDNLGIVY